MSQTRQSADDQRLAAERELFERLHDADASDAERSAVRDELIETHMPLVHHLARRYADRGEPIEDVTQVATIGLIQAIDKFDPERGSAFSTYAVPTILGAIRRHFRDATWSVKVPRRVQELRGKIDAAHDALAQELGRSPPSPRSPHAPMSIQPMFSTPWNSVVPEAQHRSTQPPTAKLPSPTLSEISMPR